MLRSEVRPLEVVGQFALEAASMAISAKKFHPIAPHVKSCDDLRELMLVCIVEVRSTSVEEYSVPYQSAYQSANSTHADACQPYLVSSAWRKVRSCLRSQDLRRA